jgi:hypothetical protein
MIVILIRSQEALKIVTPANAGGQHFLAFLDSGFRRNDREGRFLAFHVVINLDMQKTYLMSGLLNGSERILRASSGVATSRPNSAASLTIRSTSLSLVASSPFL